MDDIHNIFNEKLNIKDNNDIKELENNMSKLSINNIYVYIYSSNICSPNKYKKGIKYLNLISILVSDVKNNGIDIMKINPKELNIRNKYIKYKNKIKKDNYYIYFIYLKKRFNLINSGFVWRDLYNFYTMYNVLSNNFMNEIIKSDNYNKYRRKEVIHFYNNNKYILDIYIKEIYKNMNIRFSKIFL